MDSIVRKESIAEDVEASSSQTVMPNQDDEWPEKLLQSMLADTERHESDQGHGIMGLLHSTDDDDDDDDEGEGNEEDLQELLKMRKSVSDLLITNKDYSDALKLAITQIRQAIEETKRLKEYLDHADSLTDYLSRGASIPLHSEKFKLPLFPDIYQEISRIAYQAKEVEDLRISLSSFEWSEKDIKRLKEIVLKQCKKVAAIQMAEDGVQEDVFEAIQHMSNEDLLQHAIPPSGEEVLDWTLIAREMGETHTPESCRTRWMMKERPNVNKKDWTEDEFAKLQISIEKHKDEGQEINWESISLDVGNGRLAIDCFAASQKNGPINQDASLQSSQEESLTLSEKKQIESLLEIWGPRSALIREHLAIPHAKSTIDAYIAQLQSERQKAPEIWLMESDVELVRHLARSIKSTRQVILRDPWRVKEVDWDANFPMKPYGVSSDDVKQRWQRIVRDSKVHPQKYFDVSKRAAEEEVPTNSKKPRGRPRKKL